MRINHILTIAAALALCSPTGQAGEWPAKLTPAAAPKAKAAAPAATGNGAQRFATQAVAPRASP